MVGVLISPLTCAECGREFGMSGDKIAYITTDEECFTACQGICEEKVKKRVKPKDEYA